MARLPVALSECRSVGSQFPPFGLASPLLIPMSASGRVFRRDFLRLTAGAALLTLQSKTTQGSPPPEKPAEALKIVVFSKHLQWLDGEGLARTAAELGFDGVDLTVRTGGHIL